MKTKTILDYIRESRKADSKLLVEYFKLAGAVAETSSKAFMSLYELVEKNSDKKLRREAQRMFGKTVVEVAAMLNQLNSLEKEILGGEHG